MDEGLGDVETLLVVAYKPAPTGEPAEGALHHPAARQDLEAWLLVDAPDDLDDEVPEVGFVHQLRSIVGAVGEEVLQPRPALAHCVEDHLRAGAVGDISGGQVDQQQTAIRVHRHMALAADDLFGGIEAALRARRGGLHRLAVDHACRGAGLASGPFAVEHHGHVVNGAE